ncbi:RDD family protein [Streptomyces durhamensis]|uniref:RDD family protein n=1 Tax=Streptomyces durhamensis TaxID=68194 RepID=UPI0004CCF6BA|nr:RDD family protein [Streptomyces durhamensis]
MSAPTPAPGDDRPREGYYPDPSIPGYVRYWNGASWVPGTSRPAPKDGEPLIPPPGVRAAPAAVEETGPHFFDEDPRPTPSGQDGARAWTADGPGGTGHAGYGTPGTTGQAGAGASGYGAGRPGAGGQTEPGAGGPHGQRGGGGQGAGQAGAGGAGRTAADPRVPAESTARPAGQAGTAPVQPAEGDEPDPGGTFLFRRPVPGPAAVTDDGTMTFRPVPGQGRAPASGGRGTGAADAAHGTRPAPGAEAGAHAGPGVYGPAQGAGSGAHGPGQGAAPGAYGSGPGAGFGPQGAAQGTGFGAPAPGAEAGPGAGFGAQGPALPGQGHVPGAQAAGSGSAPGGAAGAGSAAASAGTPGVSGGFGPQGPVGAPTPPAAASSPNPAPAGGPGFGAGKAAAARAAGGQAGQPAQAAPASLAPSVPAQGGAPATPVTSGPGGGQASWAQQVHQLAGGGDEQPVVPWKPPVEDPFQAAARRQAAARPAGLGKRFAARLIDSLVVGAVTAAAAVPLGLRAADHIQEKVDAAKLSGREVTVWLLDGTTATSLGIVLAVLLVFGVVYEVLPTAKWGRTLGKKLLGLEVRDIEAHEPPAFGPALRRWLVYSVPGLLGIGIVGVLWCLFDRPWHQCWHDKAAHTFVAG